MIDEGLRTLFLVRYRSRSCSPPCFTAIKIKMTLEGDQFYYSPADSEVSMDIDA